MATKKGDTEFPTTKEAKAAAIKAAKTPAQLDKLWAEWEERGQSRDGLLYAQLLIRKQQLGAKLPEGDIERIERAEQARQAGAQLPPITGRRG